VKYKRTTHLLLAAAAAYPRPRAAHVNGIMAMRRVLAVSLLLAANQVAAQQLPSLALGADFGPAIPLGDFADQGAELGWTANLSATVRLTRLLGVSAFYARSSFGLEDLAGHGPWTDSGFGGAARVWLPVGHGTRMQPWMQLGVGRHDLDPLFGRLGLASLDTEGITTIEGSAGIDVPLTPRLLLLGPTFRYRKYSFEVEPAPKAGATGRTWEATISSFSVGAGLAVVVGGSVRQAAR
jgi:hypothetical protein